MVTSLSRRADGSLGLGATHRTAFQEGWSAAANQSLGVKLVTRGRAHVSLRAWAVEDLMTESNAVAVFGGVTAGFF